MFKCVPARCRILSDTSGFVKTGAAAFIVSLGVATSPASAQDGMASDGVLLRGSAPVFQNTHGAKLFDVAKALSRATAVQAHLADASGAAGEPLTTGSIRTGGDTGYSDWFRFDPEVEADWRIGGVIGEPNTVRITSRAAFDPGRSTKRPRVFVLYPRRSSAYDTSITQILSVFAQKGIHADITVMNFNRDGDAAQAALEHAKRLNSDLIFAMGSESTAWLWNNFKGGEIPVVSVCSKDPVMLGQAKSYDEGTGTNFAFTSLNMTVEAQLAYVFGLKPDLKNLAVLVDANNVSAVQTQSKPIAAAARKRGVRVVELALQDRANAPAEIGEMVSGAVKAMKLNDPSLDSSLFWITGSTAVFREIETINEHANRVPVLSVVPEVVQPGDASAALSVGISFKSNAHLSALYGSKVLNGSANVGDLKVGVPSPPDIAINFKRVREIGMRMPFTLFEAASTVVDYEGKAVRRFGKTVKVDG